MQNKRGKSKRPYAPLLLFLTGIST